MSETAAMEMLEEGIEGPRALCRCGKRTSRVAQVITTLLFGRLIWWRCPDCGDRWHTR